MPFAAFVTEIRERKLPRPVFYTEFGRGVHFGCQGRSEREIALLRFMLENEKNGKNASRNLHAPHASPEV